MRSGYFRVVTALALLVLIWGCTLIRMRNLEEKEETISVITYSLQTTIDRPVEAVWDLTRMWNTYVVGWAEYTTNSSYGLTGIGNYSTGRASLLGKSVTWNEVVTEWEEGRTVKFVYSGDVRSMIKISMEPHGDKTLYNFTAHTFFLPDNMMNSTLNSWLEQGLLSEILDKAVTDWIVQDIATLEGKKPEEVQLDQDKTYDVFVDAYLKATETFEEPAWNVFRLFDSTGELAAVLPVDSIEPVGDSPEEFSEMGNHYKMTVTEGMDTPLVYDMILIQYDPPLQERFYIYAHGVCMEMDIFMYPTLSGTKVIIVFVLDLPESIDGRALDVFIHTSNIDQAVQQALARLNGEE